MPHKPGASDEAIGRPEPVREGRYQVPGAPAGNSVKKGDEGKAPDRTSTPVTRQDYTGKPGDRAHR